MGTETNQKLNKQEEEENIPLIAICSFAVITIIMILLGIMMCELPVVMVCSIVILETLIAVCLHNLPIWVHVMILADRSDRRYFMYTACLYRPCMYCLRNCDFSTAFY